MSECPHCGYDWDEDDWESEWTPPRPYWQRHPFKFAKGKIRGFWRYTILRKKRPVLSLSDVSAILREVYLPEITRQLNEPSYFDSLLGGLDE